MSFSNEWLDTSTSMFAVALAAVGLLFSVSACGDSTQDRDNQTESCNDKSEKHAVGDREYCVYTGSQPITETGFDCPQGFPHRKQVGDTPVCSSDEEIPEDHRQDIDERYNDDGVGDSSPTEVGENPKFTKCENIDKTEEYCAAERLVWEYDSDASKVSVDHRRVQMNCCGDRSIQAFELEDGSFEIRETDNPSEDGRCACKCVFNYGVDIPDVSGEIDVSVVREQSDADDSPLDIWSGSIDLGQGSGEVVVDDQATDPTTGCGVPEGGN